MEERNENGQPEVVEISPLGKWKRVLAFLADFFLIFILSLGLFHLGIHPLGKAMTSYQGRVDETKLVQKDRDGVLYYNKLLFPVSSTLVESGDFASNLEHTFKTYLYFYLDGAVTIEKYEVNKSDVFSTYYVSIRNDKASYQALYNDLDNGGFFEVGETVKLKPTYIEEFKHAYLAGDELSEQGKKDYDALQSKVFLKGFNRMLDDINAKDLTYQGVSYRQKQELVTAFINYEKILTITCALIAYLLGCFIVTMMVPLLSKNRKTLGMLFLREVRLDSERLILLKKKRVLLFFVYQIIMNMGSIFFIPMGAYDFVSLFSLPALLPISLIGLLYLVFSLIYMLFEPFNRTISDKLSGTVMVTDDTLDQIYRAKGYNV